MTARALYFDNSNGLSLVKCCLKIQLLTSRYIGTSAIRKVESRSPGRSPRILNRGSSNERTSEALVEAKLFQGGRTEYKEYTARSGTEEDKENGSREWAGET